MEAAVPWIDSLSSAVAQRESAVLVVVAAVQGSAPREAGTTMVVLSWPVRAGIPGPMTTKRVALSGWSSMSSARISSP